MLYENDPKINQGDGQKNDPSTIIEKPEDVPASNDAKIDEDFPGYPHSPANEEILKPVEQ